MRTADIVTAALLILLGSIVLYDATQLGFGWANDGPKSGFFPFWLAALMVILSILILVQNFSARTKKPFVNKKDFIPVLKVLLPIGAFMAVTDPPGRWSGLGLYVASGLYLGFYMRWVGRHSWFAVATLATIVPAITFIIFEIWFLVPMPKGPLEAWLGF